MADRLTAQQIADYSGHVMTKKIARTATIDNASISATDITSRVKKWGKIKFGLYNKHPKDRGDIVFPVVSLMVDNSDGYFNRGGVIFPLGKDDFASTVLTVVVSVGGTTYLDFTGTVREPEYTESGYINLVAEHPLTQINRREWTRDDRIGGDTGIDWFFNS